MAAVILNSPAPGYDPGLTGAGERFHPPQSGVTKGKGTTMSGQVTVACKIPNGLILQLSQLVDTAEVTPQGYRTIKKAQPIGPQVHIAGYSAPFMAAARAPIVCGYALTRGVDADFWEAWLNQNHDADCVRNGLIFAHEKTADTRAQAKEQRAVTDNQGPLVPDTDRRIPTKRNKDGKQVPAIASEGAEVDED